MESVDQILSILSNNLLTLKQRRERISCIRLVSSILKDILQIMYEIRA